MVGSLVGGALGVVGSIFGGISARKAARRARAEAEAQRKRSQDMYDRRYYEDATQRADAQRMIQMTEDAVKRRNQSIAGTAAVMGSTEESIASAKKAGNEAVADVASRIVASGEARKDAIEQTYQQQQEQASAQAQAAHMQRAQGISHAVGGAINAGAHIATSGLFDKEP